MIFVVSMCLKFANLPSPLVDCGGIINAKEDPFEINFLSNNTLYVRSLAGRRRAVSVNANMGPSVCRVASLPEGH